MNCGDPQQHWHWWLLAYPILECWLGHTNRTRANSVIDLGFLIGEAVIRKFKNKETEK